MLQQPQHASADAAFAGVARGGIAMAHIAVAMSNSDFMMISFVEDFGT